MIISPFWLRVRWTADYPAEEFEVTVSNLEAVALRFRFRFVATQVSESQDCTQTLRDHVDPLSNFRGTASLLGKSDWNRDGHLYSTRWDILIGPGETHRSGLASVKPIDLPGMFTPDVFEAAGVLRGHWELSLPSLRQPLPTSAPRPQLDHPAQVLVAAFRRMHGTTDGKVTHESTLPMPLASGRAEHLIAPDAPRRLAASATTATRAKRGAATRKRR